MPSVAESDVASACTAERITLPPCECGQRQCEWTLLRPQHTATSVLRHLDTILHAGAAQVGSEQDIRTKRVVPLESDFDEQHIALHAGDDSENQLEAIVPMNDSDRRTPGCAELHHMPLHAFDFDPEPFAVTDDETHVADLRDVDTRVIDLVENSPANGEPQPRGAERAADHFLGAAAPRRRYPGRTRRKGVHWRTAFGRPPARCAPF